jgi:hypothetical protein
MARPEKQVNPVGGPLAEFALGLRELRQRAGGISYRELSEVAHCSASVLSEAAAGNRFPTWTVTKAYVRACGGDADAWRRRWGHTRASLSRPRTVADWQEIVSKRARELARDSRMIIDPESSTAAAAGDSVVPDRPNPRLVRTIPQLVEEMNRLRIWHGRPSLRRLALGSGHAFGSSTLAEALHHRDRLPSFGLLTAFVQACGEPPDLVEEWKNAWRRIELGEPDAILTGHRLSQGLGRCDGPRLVPRLGPGSGPRLGPRTVTLARRGVRGLLRGSCACSGPRMQPSGADQASPGATGGCQRVSRSKEVVLP